MSRALNALCWALTIAVVGLLIGLITPAVVGSGRVADYRPIISLTVNLWKWIKASGEAANTPEENPEPFVDVVRDSARQTGEAIAQRAENMGELPTQYQAGPMLAMCDELSDRPSTDVVPVVLADGVKAAWLDGKRLSVPELREQMGSEHCSYGDDSRRWLVGDLMAIDAHGNDKPELRFTNF